MRSNTLLWTILLLLIASQAVASPTPRQKLIRGKTASIETDYEIGDAAVSDGRICDFMITDGRKEIYLNPLQEGSATLTIWDAGGNKKDVVPVEVSNTDLENMAAEVKDILADENVAVKVSGKKVYVTGEAMSKAALSQAAALAAKHPEIENRMEMSKEVLSTRAGIAESAINMPGIKVRSVRGRLVLEGVAYSSSAAKRAAEIAALYDADMLNLIEVRETGRRVGADRMVKLDVYFMEIKKEALRGIGVSWAPGSVPKDGGSAGGGGGNAMSGIANIATSLIGFVFNLVPKLKFLRESGKARVLDTASLLVKSGEAGDLFSGTQVPYYSGDQVTFKDVGIKVHAEPIASGSSVDLNINATLSALSANIQAGIDTKSVSTSAFVPAGEAVVIANTVSNRDVKTYNKKPSDIDTSSALLNLALSKDFQSGRSEFVMFVLPEAVESASPAEEKLREYLDLEGETIKDRSGKEYREYLARTGSAPAPDSGAGVLRKARKWR